MKRLLLLLLLAPAPAAAQTASSDAAVSAVRAQYEQVRGYLTRAAEQMPEADYAYQPTPEVRSYGRMLGHVANAQYAICAAALGESSPNAENIERTRTTKAALIEALQGSFAYCDRAYALDDASALQPTRLFGQEQSRLAALVLNAGHNYEHYGNLVTYLRLKGMVPPSSQQGS